MSRPLIRKERERVGHPAGERYFYLTSPLIEPAHHKDDHLTSQQLVVTFDSAQLSPFPSAYRGPVGA